jgi:hypothetical protein
MFVLEVLGDEFGTVGFTASWDSTHDDQWHL